MTRKSTHIGFWVSMIFILCISFPAAAQVHIERISVTERSDGLGYVLRYHLTGAVDSVSVSRPEAEIIQMILWSPGMTADENLDINPNDLVREFQFFEQPGGFGIELALEPGQYHSIQSYPDQNERDYLLAFERITEGEMETVLTATESRDMFRTETETVPESETGAVSETEPFGQQPEDPDVEPEPEEEADLGEEESDIREKVSARVQGFWEKRDRSSASLQSLMPGDPMEFYVRTMLPPGGSNGDPSYHLRPVSMQSYEPALQGQNQHIWSEHPFFTHPEGDESSFPLRFFTPQLFYSNNSKRPAGFNDGALWQGRGMNLAVSTGVSAHYGPVRAVFRPVLVHSENRDFELSDDAPYEGLSPFAMAKTNIDLPQRFGEDPVTRFDLGDSYIELEYEGFSGGFSNRRMWTGPAIHNPLMFSTNAPGFLHGFAGTSKPLAVPGGRLGGRIFWGGLKESGYFDENPGNNLRYITGLFLNYSPDFVPGLHLGYTRVGYSYIGNGLSFSDLFLAFKASPEKPDPEAVNPENVEFMKGSFFIRWAYPRIGFEVYTEWGRNDDKRKIRDRFLEPELNRGYVLGVLQRVPAGGHGAVVLNAEVTNLENMAVTTQFRDTNIWYANDVIRQGFTHRGQVLGSAIGPGSSTQVLTATYYHKYGMAGISAARVAMHNDRLFENREYYHSTLPRDWMTIRRIHEVEIRYGFHAMVFLPGNLELQMDLYTGNIEGRYNNLDRPPGGNFDDDIYFDERNVNLSFTLRYQLDGFLR